MPFSDKQSLKLYKYTNKITEGNKNILIRKHICVLLASVSRSKDRHIYQRTGHFPLTDTLSFDKFLRPVLQWLRQCCFTVRLSNNTVKAHNNWYRNTVFSVYFKQG